jgi:hypothetical protein
LDVLLTPEALEALLAAQKETPAPNLVGPDTGLVSEHRAQPRDLGDAFDAGHGVLGQRQAMMGGGRQNSGR